MTNKAAQQSFKRARRALGLDLNGMARALRLSAGRSIRRYEDGSREVSGPVSLCADLLPPLVTLLGKWDGMSDAELIRMDSLTEMEADAIADLRKVLDGCGLLQSRSPQRHLLGRYTT